MQTPFVTICHCNNKQQHWGLTIKILSSVHQEVNNKNPLGCRLQQELNNKKGVQQESNKNPSRGVYSRNGIKIQFVVQQEVLEANYKLL